MPKIFYTDRHGREMATITIKLRVTREEYDALKRIGKHYRNQSPADVLSHEIDVYECIKKEEAFIEEESI